MKLVTLADGRCGLVEGEVVRVLGGVFPGGLAHVLREGLLEDLGAGVRVVDELPLGAAALAAPVPRPGKVICVGLNYADHAAESGQALPERPLLFNKLPDCVVGPGAPIVRPPGATKLDHEAELAVVIGRRARHLGESDALSCVAGYSCFNDVSERDAQLGDGQWLRGKSYDGFGPFGPVLVTVDEVPDPQALHISCRVNGEARQDSSTSQMAFSVAELIAYCSRWFPLNPGDVLATGTPAGVGLGSGRFLEPGDTVEVEIEGCGVLINPVEQGPASGRGGA